MASQPGTKNTHRAWQKDKGGEEVSFIGPTFLLVREKLWSIHTASQGTSSFYLCLIKAHLFGFTLANLARCPLGVATSTFFVYLRSFGIKLPGQKSVIYTPGRAKLFVLFCFKLKPCVQLLRFGSLWKRSKVEALVPRLLGERRMQVESSVRRER